MPKYLVLIYGDESVWENAPQQWHDANGERHAAFVAAAAGAVLGGGELAPSGTATSVRAGAGDTRVTTDGPFVESKEAIGGYYLIQAPDDDEARRLAALVPEAGDVTSGVELRRIVD